MNICTPSLIYLVVALCWVSLSIAIEKNTICKTIVKLIMVACITYVLNYICKKYSVSVAWYILGMIIAFPFLLGFAVLVGINVGYRKWNEMLLKDEEKKEQMEKQMY